MNANRRVELCRANSYDDGVRRSQQFADRRAEIDAGVAAARARAASMQDRCTGGAMRRTGPASSTSRGSAAAAPDAPSDTEDWHADALPASHQFRTADETAAPETKDKASKAEPPAAADSAGTGKDVDAAVGARR